MLHSKSLLELFSSQNSFLQDGSKYTAFTSTKLASPQAAGKTQVCKFETFATIPKSPGFPEGIAVNGGRCYVSGPANFLPTPDKSNILVYDKMTGAWDTNIVVEHEDTAKNHALSCIAVDHQGHLYVLTAQPDPTVPPEGRLGVLRFKRNKHEHEHRHEHHHEHQYVQERYADPFPTAPGAISLPNDIVFADDGTAYVTDSFQATIWRIPAGGGTPEVWLSDEKLRGGGQLPIGVNGIRLDPARRHVYFSVSTTASNPSTGSICRVPLVDNPQASDIEVFHSYDYFEVPDGFAFGKSGNLYVALAAANAISVLSPEGMEIKRLVSDPTDAIPLDGPANIAFHNASRSLLITNHASLSGNMDHFAVLKLYVDDVESPLAKPNIP